MRRLALFTLAIGWLYGKQYDYTTLMQVAFDKNTELKIASLDALLATTQQKIISSEQWGNLTLSHTMGRTNNALDVFGAKLASRKATFADFGLASYTGAGSLYTTPSDLNHPQAVNAFDTSLQYSLPLFTGFKLTHSTQAFTLMAQAKALLVTNNKRLLALEIYKTSLQALAFYQRHIAFTQSEQSAQELVKTAQAFVDTGMGVSTDVLQAQSRLQEAQTYAIQSLSAYKNALTYLRFLTGLSDIDSISEPPMLTNSLAPLSHWKEQSVHNEYLKSLEIRYKSLEAIVKTTESYRYPQAHLHLKYGMYDSTLTGGLPKDYYSMGIGINYTLFDAQKNSLENQKASLEYQKALNDWEMAKNKLLTDIEQLYTTYQWQHHHIQALQTRYHNSEKVFENHKISYQNNLIPMSTLMIKHAEYEQNKATYIQALYDEKETLATLFTLSGKSLYEEKQ